MTRALTDCRNALSPMLGINTHPGSYQTGMIRDSVCYEDSTTKGSIPCLAIAFHQIGTPFPKGSIPFWTCSQKGSKHGRRAGRPQHGDLITKGSQPPNMLRRISRRLTCMPRCPPGSASHPVDRGACSEACDRCQQYAHSSARARGCGPISARRVRTICASCARGTPL